jgi:hypothetical protein
MDGIAVHHKILELVQLRILSLQVLNIRFDADRSAGDALDQLAGGELAAVAIDVFD